MSTKIKTSMAGLGHFNVHPLTVLFLISSLSFWFFQSNETLTGSLETSTELIMKDSPVLIQSTIRGKVIDFDGNVLSGINVCLYNEFGDSLSSHNSQINGEFVIGPLELGEYKIGVNDPKYEAFESTVMVYKEGAYIDVELYLKSNSKSLTSRKTGLIPMTSFVNLSAGVTMGNGLQGRGTRADGTAVYIDGVRCESYESIKENGLIKTVDMSVSTFSTDVDNASYTNVRRMIHQQQVPLMDAVRVEEFINYFDYAYEEPKADEDISIQMAEGVCPWQPEHKLVKIGLKTRNIEQTEMSRSNLVFLIDVSGSMESENKLPLVKSALSTLLDHLHPEDRVAIVTYAGNTKVALTSTPCSDTSKIKRILRSLDASGSTAGGAGIVLAYEQAKRNFINEGNNRIILVTDGDFNVGITGGSELLKLIEEKRKEGVYLTVCGFGMGNIKDSRMEMLADNGNGSYYYIDHLKEAERVFGYGLTSTLMTMAEDVKIQVEFNPKFVQAYRLIGYENRKLENADFVNDAKDAGEMGAGQSVTALYEIIPRGVKMKDSTMVKLKYKRTKEEFNDTLNEVLTVKVRYKKPKTNTSIEISEVLIPSPLSENVTTADFRLASAVALFGMLLRGSEFTGKAGYEQVLILLEGIENEKVNELKDLVKWMNEQKK